MFTFALINIFPSIQNVYFTLKAIQQDMNIKLQQGAGISKGRHLQLKDSLMVAFPSTPQHSILFPITIISSVDNHVDDRKATTQQSSRDLILKYIHRLNNSTARFTKFPPQFTLQPRVISSPDIA